MRTKHFVRLHQGGDQLRPFSLLFEVRVDFHDVRSGQTGNETGLFWAPVLIDPDLDWTEDMVHPASWSEFCEVEPREPVAWPDWADGQIIRFFLKHRRIRLYKNTELGLYSSLNEPRSEFVRRCFEQVYLEQQLSVFQLRDLFLRRFLEAGARYRDQLDETAAESEGNDAREAELRDVSSEIRDRFGACFARNHSSFLTPSDLSWKGPQDVELRERLESIRDEFLSQYNLLLESLISRAERIEDHEVALSHSEIEVSTHAILWSDGPLA